MGSTKSTTHLNLYKILVKKVFHTALPQKSGSYLYALNSFYVLNFFRQFQYQYQQNFIYHIQTFFSIMC